MPAWCERGPDVSPDADGCCPSRSWPRRSLAASGPRAAAAGVGDAAGRGATRRSGGACGGAIARRSTGTGTVSCLSFRSGESGASSRRSTRAAGLSCRSGTRARACPAPVPRAGTGCTTSGSTLIGCAGCDGRGCSGRSARSIGMGVRLNSRSRGPPDVTAGVDGAACRGAACRSGRTGMPPRALPGCIAVARE